MTDDPFGVYIHIPFCIRKCRYCSFYSCRQIGLIGDYIDALESEIYFYRDTAREADTVYIGGGTPSVLSLLETERILSAVYRFYRLTSHPEITIEANPRDITKEYIHGIRQAGVNRLSLGIQSFEDRELGFLGRRHNEEQAVRSIETAVEAGIERLNLDIIWGLPGQSIKSLLKNLEKAVFFKPGHISAYELTISEGTPLYSKLKEGAFKSLCVQEKSDMFYAVSDYLRSEGYVHYEVSNFSLGYKAFSRHNSRYWNHSPYIGFGPSSHSFDGNRRWWNWPDTIKYISEIKKGLMPVENEEMLSAEQKATERLMLGLRTSHGVPVSDLSHTPRNRGMMDMLVREEFAVIQEDRLCPTVKGMLVSDYLPLLFDTL